MVVEDVVHVVVADEMMGNALNCDAHGLLHKAVCLETIRVDQGTDELPLHVCGRLLGAKRCCLRSGRRVAAFVAGSFGSCIWIAWSTGSSLLILIGSLLLARRKGLIEFSIDQEIPKDPAGAPGNAISPAFNARRVLLIDEDTATPDELVAFAVMRAAWNMG